MLANHLDGIFGAAIRKKIYAVLGLIGVALTAVAAYAAATDADVPAWALGAGAVVTLFLAGGQGVATANTAPPVGDGWESGYGPEEVNGDESR